MAALPSLSVPTKLTHHQEVGAPSWRSCINAGGWRAGWQRLGRVALALGVVTVFLAGPVEGAPRVQDPSDWTYADVLPAAEIQALDDIKAQNFPGWNWDPSMSWTDSVVGLTIEDPAYTDVYDEGDFLGYDLTTQGRVRLLNLTNRGLPGEIPASLGDLAKLELLYLNGNQLSGEIPASLGNLANLRWLWLFGNQLSGEIPASLGNLANLEQLWLYSNQLSGEIPASLGNLNNMERLYLHTNQLSGEIPASLGNLANLKWLWLYSNQLSGEIPASLGNLTNLVRLNLDRNQLSGEIPASLGNLANLERLYLFDNQLSGEIPASLGNPGNLANLKSLFLNRNQLSGEIPASLSNLANLERLYLHTNELSGEIPASLGDLGNLEELFLNSNQLSGEIPASLGNLANLWLLALAGNQLSGEIPASLGDLVNLRRLELNWNQLSGEIPVSLGNLAELQSLLLDENQLSGSVRADENAWPALSRLELENNLFDDSPGSAFSNAMHLLGQRININTLIWQPQGPPETSGYHVAVGGAGRVVLDFLEGEVLRVVGLPPGLRFDRETQEVTGTALRVRPDGEAYVARALVANDAGGTEWKDLSIAVEALPAWLVGGYQGHVEVVPSAEGLLARGGEMSVRVLPTGALSGRLVLGSRVLPLRGRVQGYVGQSQPGIVITAVLEVSPVRNDPSQDLVVELRLEAGTAGAGVMNGEVRAADAESGDGLAVVGWQTHWNPRSNPALGGGSARVHTILAPVDEPGAGEDFPGGSGFAVVTILRDGIARLQLTLADGVRLGGVGRMSADGDLYLYRHLYRGGGAVLLELQADDMDDVPAELAGDLRWVKFADVRERDYSDGFDLETTALGRPFTRPVPGEFLFTESGSPPDWLSLQLQGLGIEDEPILEDFNSEGIADIPVRLNERNQLINDPQAPGRARAVMSPFSGLAQGNILLPRQLPNGRRINLNTIFRGLYLPPGNGEPGAVFGFFQKNAEGLGGSVALRQTGSMAIVINDPDPGADLQLVQGGVMALELGETGGEVISVQGLPRGVRFDRDSQQLIGLVRFPAGATAIVRLPDGTRATVELALDAEPLPGWLPGSYAGPVEVTEPGHDGLLGRGGEVRVQISARGQYSGQLRVGPRVFGFRGVLSGFDGRIDPAAEALTALNTIVPVRTDAGQNLELELNFELGAGNAGVVSGQLSGQGENLAARGWRSPWTAFGNPAWGGNNGVRVHTIINPVGAPGVGDEFPGGFSYAVVTLFRNGQARVLASLADGTNTAGIGSVSAEGELYLYRALNYRGGGSALLELQADEVDDVPGEVAGGMRWLKLGHPLERSYTDGFDLESPALGRPYVRPPAGEFLFTADGSEPEDLLVQLEGLEIEEDQEFADFVQGGLVAVPAEVDALNRVVLPADAPGRLRVNLNLNSGLSSGNFLLPREFDSGRSGSLNVLHRGLYLPPGAMGEPGGVHGFFLQPDEGFNGPLPSRRSGAMAVKSWELEGFARIPVGWFTMGNTSGDTDSNATPANVFVSEFYMAKYEVTWELWNEVRDWGLDNNYTDIAAGEGKGPNHPVQMVNWWDVVKWCNARSERDGLTPVYTVDGNVKRTGTSEPVADWNANGYRLPTEAEWEKAARGGVSGWRYPWGDEINHDHANYRANGSTYTYDTSPYTAPTYHPAYDDGTFPYTAPVGSFAPNGYGLYDMVGNSREWCWDWSSAPYTEGAIDPKGAASGSFRVLRGGGWSDHAFLCRSSYRTGYSPGRDDYVGFRPVRSVVP